MTSLAAIRARAESAPSVELRPDEPHPAGMVLGLASLGLGVWASSRGGPDAVAWGWAGLAGVVASMALYLRWRVPGPGWQVDFEARRVRPVGQAAGEVAVDGGGWTVRTGPGDRFATMAVDLMHAERGRVARLFEHGALRRSHRRQVSALADALASRLAADRSGPRY